MALVDFLNMTVEIWRRSAGTENEYGEAKDTWSKVADLTCTIQPKTGDIAREENGILITSTHRLYCLAGANLHEGDKVKKNSQQFNVISVRDAAGRAHHMEVDLDEIE